MKTTTTQNGIKTFLPLFKGFYGSIVEDDNFEGEAEHFGLPETHSIL